MKKQPYLVSLEKGKSLVPVLDKLNDWALNYIKAN